MGASAVPIVIRSEPGIKRDGTRYEGDNYTDGQWIRFQRGLPRKIGGYRMINRYLSEVSRGFNSFTQNQLQYCHTGGATKLERFTIDATYSASIISDRTPAAGFTPDPLNKWMFANAYDSSSTDNQIFAHVAPNASCICNDLGGDIFAGELVDTAALTAVALPAGANASGGIVMLHPYLFFYGSAGIVGWSVAGEPTDLTSAGSGVARIWSQKIIKGIPIRGGSGSSPSGLFIAYDAVLRASFVGDTAVFAFDTIATETSIISPDSVVDYDGVIYWAGVDRFLCFNGVVREVPNNLNVNYFFDNIAIENRAKVFAFKMPRFGEIWWCFPFGSATECNHAVIYNVRENTWYDTALPSQFRTAGSFNNAFARPMLCDAEAVGTKYGLWLHESGTDEINGMDLKSIRSYFETADMSSLLQGANRGIGISFIEPDFVQSGPMNVEVRGRANPRAQEVNGTARTFPAVATSPEEQLVTVKEQRRELRLYFESNSPGGDFQAGQTIGHVAPSDGTMIG